MLLRGIYIQTYSFRVFDGMFGARGLFYSCCRKEGFEAG